MLTKKQLDLLDFIHKRVQRDGVPPSFDEMKEALDLRSKSGIHRLITALEERGFIRRLPHRARAIEIIKLPEALDKGAGGRAGFEPRVIHGDRPAQMPPGAMPLDSAPALELPLLGRIAAGTPIEAISDACASRGVARGIFGMSEPAVRPWLDQGFSLVCAGVGRRIALHRGA